MGTASTTRIESRNCAASVRINLARNPHRKFRSGKCGDIPAYAKIKQGKYARTKKYYTMPVGGGRNAITGDGGRIERSSTGNSAFTGRQL